MPSGPSVFTDGPPPLMDDRVKGDPKAVASRGTLGRAPKYELPPALPSFSSASAAGAAAAIGVTKSKSSVAQGAALSKRELKNQQKMEKKQAKGAGAMLAAAAGAASAAAGAGASPGVGATSSPAGLSAPQGASANSPNMATASATAAAKSATGIAGGAFGKETTSQAKSSLATPLLQQQNTEMQDMSQMGGVDPNYCDPMMGDPNMMGDPTMMGGDPGYDPTMEMMGGFDDGMGMGMGMEPVMAGPVKIKVKRQREMDPACIFVTIFLLGLIAIVIIGRCFLVPLFFDETFLLNNAWVQCDMCDTFPNADGCPTLCEKQPNHPACETKTEFSCKGIGDPSPSLCTCAQYPELEGCVNGYDPNVCIGIDNPPENDFCNCIYHPELDGCDECTGLYTPSINCTCDQASYMSICTDKECVTPSAECTCDKYPTMNACVECKNVGVPDHPNCTCDHPYWKYLLPDCVNCTALYTPSQLVCTCDNFPNIYGCVTCTEKGKPVADVCTCENYPNLDGCVCTAVGVPSITECTCEKQGDLLPECRGSQPVHKGKYGVYAGAYGFVDNDLGIDFTTSNFSTLKSKGVTNVWFTAHGTWGTTGLDRYVKPYIPKAQSAGIDDISFVTMFNHDLNNSLAPADQGRVLSTNTIDSVSSLISSYSLTATTLWILAFPVWCGSSTASGYCSSWYGVTPDGGVNVSAADRNKNCEALIGFINHANANYLNGFKHVGIIAGREYGDIFGSCDILAHTNNLIFHHREEKCIKNCTDCGNLFSYLRPYTRIFGWNKALGPMEDYIPGLSGSPYNLKVNNIMWYDIDSCTSS